MVSTSTLLLLSTFSTNPTSDPKDSKLSTKNSRAVDLTTCTVLVEFGEWHTLGDPTRRTGDADFDSDKPRYRRVISGSGCRKLACQRVPCLWVRLDVFSFPKHLCMRH